MDLTAYDSIGRTNIFNKTYKTTTGIEIFDDIDNMISEVLKGAMNIDMKNIAAIHFMDFRIANENYMLYINDRLIASPSNTNFSLILKIIPEKNYSIVLKQADGDRTVLKTDVRLPQNGSTNIGYAGSGNVSIGGIAFKDRLKTYSLYFDNGRVSENSFISNIPTDFNHELVIVADSKYTNYYTNFNLYDSKTAQVNASAVAYGSLHAEVIGPDFNIASLIIQYFPFGRYFCIGAGAGFCDSALAVPGTSFLYVSPLVDLEYYLIGDMSYDFRASFGLIGRYDIAVNGPGLALPVDVGAFISIDYLFFTIRPECYVYRDDSGNYNFLFTAAAGIHF